MSLLTAIQEKTAEAIVNLFETGEVLGDYGQVTLLQGDTGHLTFGRSQTTLGSGNLHDLLRRYCGNPGARFGKRLEVYLPRFAERDLSLDQDQRVHNLLRATADDPVMRGTQDVFFDERYWQPAERAAQNAGINTPLGIAVVYDSFVHGSWKTLRDLTSQQVGHDSAASEKQWIAAYVMTRRNWLAGNKRADLRSTVYRMDAFQRLIDQGYWGLDLPLVIRGREVSLATLAETPHGCYDGPQPGTRILALQTPLLRGLDVRLVQLALSDGGADIKADGIFGQTSARSLRAYQSNKHLPPTGIADISLIAELTAPAS